MRMHESIIQTTPVVESRGFQSVQISDATNVFVPYRVGEIPRPSPRAGETRMNIDQRPIAIDEAPYGTGVSFGE